jgi:site-specific DNA-methyltransferase (adenine-specific)
MRGKAKNKNQLPPKILSKIIQYSSNEGDLVCDFFLGSFATAKAVRALQRKMFGFEKNEVVFSCQIKKFANLF